MTTFYLGKIVFRVFLPSIVRSAGKQGKCRTQTRTKTQQMVNSVTTVYLGKIRVFRVFLFSIHLSATIFVYRLFMSLTLLRKVYQKSRYSISLIFSAFLVLNIQVNLDMTDSMGPGKLVRHVQNLSYTYDEYLICIGLGPSISSVIFRNLSYSGPSYPKFTCIQNDVLHSFEQNTERIMQMLQKYKFVPIDLNNDFAFHNSMHRIKIALHTIQ